MNVEPYQNNLVALCVPAHGYLCALFARNMAFTRCEDIDYALVTVAPLDLSPASHSDHASMPRSIRLLNDLAVSEKIFGSSIGSDDLSNSFLLKNTKKKLLESKEELKNVKNEKKAFLDNIGLLEAKNWFPRAEKDS